MLSKSCIFKKVSFLDAEKQKDRKEEIKLPIKRKKRKLLKSFLTPFQQLKKQMFLPAPEQDLPVQIDNSATSLVWELDSTRDSSNLTIASDWTASTLAANDDFQERCEISSTYLLIRDTDDDQTPRINSKHKTSAKQFFPNLSSHAIGNCLPVSKDLAEVDCYRCKSFEDFDYELPMPQLKAPTPNIDFKQQKQSLKTKNKLLANVHYPKRQLLSCVKTSVDV